jgi:two-component system, NarL family, sensor histidine kinase BarA
MAAAAEKTLDELTLTQEFDLEELVDRQALAEMVESFFDLFRVPLRVFGEQGKLLADSAAPLELYRYLATLPKTRAAIESVVSDVKSLQPTEDGQITHPCVTGALYRVVAIRYDARPLGRLILGPFVPPSVSELPAALVELEPELDLEKAQSLLERMPRADEATAARLANHLRRTLDLILFSGHNEQHAPRKRAGELSGPIGQDRAPATGLRPAEGARSTEEQLLGHRFARAQDAAHVDHRL